LQTDHFFQDAFVPSSNVVIDISHFNANVDLQLARQSGIRAIIHKATQGVFHFDPTYATHRTLAQNAGMLWGAYHFGVGGDGIEQADYFLNAVNRDERTLLALDFEANPQGPSMNIEEARAFVLRVKSQTGRHPGLYGGHYLKTLLGAKIDPVLADCWFWLSQYGSRPLVPVNWKTWTLWQYTDGAMGPTPHETPGIGRCDRSFFNGSEAELQIIWDAASAAQSAQAHTAPQIVL
jgi:GH25 family lysozyme M1 (1,4-beta-N-acetylmuramidase)